MESFSNHTAADSDDLLLNWSVEEYDVGWDNSVDGHMRGSSPIEASTIEVTELTIFEEHQKDIVAVPPRHHPDLDLNWRDKNIIIYTFLEEEQEEKIRRRNMTFSR